MGFTKLPFLLLNNLCRMCVGVLYNINTCFALFYFRLVSKFCFASRAGDFGELKTNSRMPREKFESLTRFDFNLNGKWRGRHKTKSTHSHTHR